MTAGRKSTPEERFWSKVQKTDTCWNFTGSFYHNGYGAFSLNRRTCYAHRVVWTWTHGEIPDGLFVCHHCDNRACVRPDHLFVGTAKDNSQDMIRKGRQGWRRRAPRVLGLPKKPRARAALRPIYVDDVIDGNEDADFGYIDSIVSVRSRWGR